MLNPLSGLGPILSNPWTIGIGGGTLSGLLVWFVTQRLFSTRENKEYLQKVSSANTEVLYALRPLISEFAFPSSVIVESVISATSKKFDIKKESMNSPMQFFDQLMKEVMDTHFIVPKKKIEYCKHLYDLRTEALSFTQPKATTNDLSISDIVKRENMFNFVSISVAITVGVTTLLLNLNHAEGPVQLSGSFTNIIAPIGAALIASMIALLSSYLDKDRNEQNSLLKRLFFTNEDKFQDKGKKL